jgi:hyperosmotically inducible protein
MKLLSYSLVIGAAICIGSLGAPALQAQNAQGYVGHGRNTQDADAMAIVKASDAADYATTQQVRSAIASDSSLSADAQDLKILTMNGRVFIAGPVGSNNEATAVLAKAIALVGNQSVIDQMYVPPFTDSLIGDQPVVAQLP